MNHKKNDPHSNLPSLDRFFYDLRASKIFKDQIVYTGQIKGNDPDYETLDFLNKDIKVLLEKNSIKKTLFSPGQCA